MTKLSKPFFILLTVATLVFFLLCLNAQTLITTSASLDLNTVAITFVNLIAEGQFEDATELFNTEMAEALSSEKLERTWNELISNVGKFKEIVGTRITEEKGYRVVYVTCEFARASLDIKVVFDEEAKIAGLWFVPAAIEGIHGIYIAAFIATGISAVLWGGLIYWLSKREWKYLALMLILLPFSTIVNLWVKKPVYDFLLFSLNVSSELSITTPWWLLLFILFLAPITEEAIKLFPLAAKQVRRTIDKLSALWIGMALGIGFGIGEIWYLAWRFSMVPGFAGYPFYYFGGFIGERMMTVFIHGVMTAVAVTGFLKGRKGLLIGYVGAVFLHAFANISAMLYQIRLWDITFASLYLILPMGIAFFIFEYLRKEQLKDKKHKETVLFSRD